MGGGRQLQAEEGKCVFVQCVCVCTVCVFVQCVCLLCVVGVSVTDGVCVCKNVCVLLNVCKCFC